jgi:hypothetical protein
VVPAEVQHAKKEPIVADAAVQLARSMSVVIAAKGASLIRVDMAVESPDDARVTELIVGRTGNLRAPSIRVGDTLVVGFNPAVYAELI